MFTVIEDGIAPKIKTEFSSSADLCAREDIIIKQGTTAIIPLGVKIDLDYFKNRFDGKGWDKDEDEADSFNAMLHKDYIEGLIYNFLQKHFFELKLRSSMAKVLIIPNGVGEIDIDYPNEICLMVHNPLTLEYVEKIFSINKYSHLHNDFENDREKIELEYGYKISKNQAVAQIKLMSHENTLMPIEYRSYDKRVDGFGSTNK